MTPNEEPLMTAEEVASYLRVKPSWVKDRCRERCAPERKIPHIRLGRGKGSYVRFRLSAVIEWLDSGCGLSSSKVQVFPRQRASVFCDCERGVRR